MADNDDVQFTRPNTLVEQEEFRKREKEGKSDDTTSEGRSFAVEGNDLSGYVGVDPEYQNYANETEAPSLTKDEQEAVKVVQEQEQANQSPANRGGTASTSTDDGDDDKPKAASKTAKE